MASSSCAAAVLVPGQQHVGVHAERRAGIPQRQRVLLAVVVAQHAVAAVQRALGHRVEQAEGRHHRAGGQDLDLQFAAGHVVDLLGEVERVLVEDVLRRPGALEAQAGDGLAPGRSPARPGAPVATVAAAADFRKRRRWAAVLVVRSWCVSLSRGAGRIGDAHDRCAERFGREGLSTPCHAADNWVYPAAWPSLASNSFDFRTRNPCALCAIGP